MKKIVVIPARYQSTRFPGKPLAKINGVEAILLTYQAAEKIAGLDDIYVATDDERIKSVCEGYGARVIMTSSECHNGTERVAEAVIKINLDDDDIVINLQGDAPLTPSWFVDAIIHKLGSTPDADMVTPVIRCDNESYIRFITDRKNNRVGATTVVFDKTGRAMYFSKEVIPYVSCIDRLATTPVFHHAGVYGYKVRALKTYTEMGYGPLEKAEQLEQLRFIENNKNVFVVEVDVKGMGFWELNNPGDISIIEEMIEANNKLK